MRVLVACEFSAVVRDAFAARGHDAWSCDLLPTEGDPAKHIEGDVLPILGDGWDLLIAHPPCTHLAVSGARWWASKPPELQREAVEFFMAFVNAPVPRIHRMGPGPNRWRERSRTYAGIAEAMAEQWDPETMRGSG